LKKLRSLILDNNVLEIIAKRCINDFDWTIKFDQSIALIEVANKYDTQQIRAQLEDCFLGDDNVTIELMLTVTKKGRQTYE
jgi:hypothetical protein